MPKLRIDARVSSAFLSIKGLLCVGVAAAALTAPLDLAHADTTFNFGDGQSLSLGLGLRASVTNDSDGAPNGGNSTSFSLDSVRLYVNGQLTKDIGATFNTERD